MSTIYDWSLTAASNSNSDSDINWAEGQAPSTVNNSARVMMERVKELLVDIGGSLTAAGTANGLTVTASSAFTAYANGQIISFRAASDNTGAATLNVNGVGAKSIRKMDSSGDVALAAGEIQGTGIYVARYSAALNGGAGAWLLLNPTLSAPMYSLSSLAVTDGNFIVGDGTTWVVESGATARASLGLAAIAASGSASDLSTGTVPNERITGAYSGITTLSCSGTITGAGVTVSGANQLLVPTGTAAAPPVSFVSSPDMGMLRISSTSLGWSVSGVLQASLSSTGTLSATTFSGSGASLTSVPAGQLTGTVASARVSGSYTGITGTGALSAGSIASGFGNINIGASTFTTTGAVNGGTGTFSGAVSMAALSAASGTFSASITTAGTVTFDSNIQSSDTTCIMATSAAGLIRLRPNGPGSTAGQIALESTGAVTINGTLTVTG